MALENDGTQNDNVSGSPSEHQEEPISNGLAPQNMRRRQRAVAEREASRLARPERRNGDMLLAHAPKSLSAVSSTPFGFHTSQHARNDKKHPLNEWCGPFSVARQMIAAREEARIKREKEQSEKETEKEQNNNALDQIVQQHELERKRKAHPSMNWRGNREAIDKLSHVDYYTKRRRRHQNETMMNSESNGRKRNIKSLFQLCIDFVVNNFEYVDSLGAIDGTIRNKICEELVAKGKFNGAAFEAIAEEGITALELIDCVHVTQDQLCEALQKLIPAGLQAIILNHSGRCFGPKAVNMLITNATSRNHTVMTEYQPEFLTSDNNMINDKTSLFALSIGGAYLLKDADASSLIQAYQTSLSSLEFKACPNLGTNFCTSIANCFASSSPNQYGNGTLLELALEDLSLSKESLLSLATTDALRNLKNIKLQSMPTVDDEVIHSILTVTSSSSEKNDTNYLEGINFSHNVKLTDAILSDIRACNYSGQLRSLELAGLKHLSSHGLEAFFTLEIPGLPRAPMLRKLNLSGCDYDAVNDTVVKYAATASSMKMNTIDSNNGETTDQSKIIIPEANNIGLSTMGGLVEVNLNGSSVTDDSMEILAATCATSLEELNLSFCTKISDKGLGYLVEKVNEQFRKIHIWGCAQLTDEFLDGHARVENDGDPLEIVGAWMKKSGGESLR